MKPPLRVSVFLDYACPFCYIGSARLLRLEDRYDLKVNWAYIELHPETPPAGQAPGVPGYAPEQLSVIDESLAALAAADALPLVTRSRVPNTRLALRMAEAAKELGREPFYRLHRTLFHAHFADGRDIGDARVLRAIVAACDLPDDLPDRAWGVNPALDARFARYRAFAAAAGTRSVPTYVFGPQILIGVQSLETLYDAAQTLTTSAATDP